MFEYRAVWSVPGGGIGYSVFHVREAGVAPIGADAQGFADDLRAGYDALKAYLPNVVTINFESEALELDVATGQLQSVIPISSPAEVEGTAGGAYSAPSGARVDHLTAAIVAGRRLRGRTFLVPLTDAVYDDGGGITTSVRTAIDAAFESFRNDTANYSLGVWSRTHGIIADVTLSATAAEAAILRGRRD